MNLETCTTSLVLDCPVAVKQQPVEKKSNKTRWNGFENNEDENNKEVKKLQVILIRDHGLYTRRGKKN